MLEFRVLGPLQVCRDGRALEVAGVKAKALLVLLLAWANEPVSPDRLIEELWGERPPASARKALQMQVLRVRRALRSGAADGEREALVFNDAGYRLVIAPDALDATRCQSLVEEGRHLLAARNANQAHERFVEALALWRGPALADLAYESCVQTQIRQLEELRTAALEARVEADLALGRHADLVGELQRLVVEHPLRERLHQQLMLALYRSGRQADALATYRRARELLVDRLGIEPGRELRELERAMLEQDAGLMLEVSDGAGAESFSAEAGSRAHVRVPLAPTPTVGREEALVELAAVVGARHGRLLTVVGAGGVGKTRVAIELAHALGPGLRDGAVFVSLAPLAAAEHVASTVARELGVALAPSESAEDSLARHLARQQLLLVLDNFEHVLDAAPLVAQLLAIAPELAVVATSREPLRLRAERLFHLGPLAVMAAHGAGGPGPAVALFAGAVQARDPTFELSGQTLPAVADACRRLDGLPLAIELAAARVGVLSVTELAARLRAGLDALGPGPRDAPDRQRTLTATLEWSHALLDPDEQRALAALAVFAGGCTRDAAEAVTGARLEVLESLVAKNLVLATTADDERGRLGMLETIRTFARGKLKLCHDAESAERRHCEYYLELAERLRPQLERTGSRTLVAEFDRDLDNIRAAFGWALADAPELALRLATATAAYWFLAPHKSEATDWLRSALALEREVPVTARAAALQYYAIGLIKRGAIAEAERAARESLELRRSLGEPGGCARSGSALATALMHSDQVRAAHAQAAEAVRLADVANDEQARAWALSTMAQTAPTLDAALALGEQAASTRRSAGNARELATLQSSLAYTALFHEHHAAAESLSREALAAARADGDRHVLALAEGNVGLAALFNGSLDAAQRAFTSELQLSIDYGLDTDFAPLLQEAINGLAAVAAAHGRDQTAATLHGAATATGIQHSPVIARRFDERFLKPAQARLGEQAWADALEAGATLNADEIVRVARRILQPRAVA